jgi:RNA polymerase sigma-70 factor, ECF subfamily
LRPPPTDEELAEACLALYPAARAVCRDPELAADLVQDTFLRAVASREQYRGDAPLGAWLRRILHNLAIDRHRRAVRELVVEEVEDALVHLPFAYRSAVVLHDAMGWTVREIADAQDIGLPAAKQRLRRGRMMLVGVRSGLSTGLGTDHRDPDSVIPPGLADRLRSL